MINFVNVIFVKLYDLWLQFENHGSLIFVNLLEKGFDRWKLVAKATTYRGKRGVLCLVFPYE